MGWKKKADEALAKRDAAIPTAWRLTGTLPRNSTPLLMTSGIMDTVELAIVELSATALAAAIASTQYTSVQVATAYCKAGSIALQATNCLIEIFPDEAHERAEWLDAELERTGKTVGPLHGVPVSIKDHIDVKGHDSPCGFLSLVGKMVATEDAYMVSVLRAAGAVFYCKSTNPQSIMHLETSGYYGVTVCPYNRDLTSGGSSGGEGALIGMKGSPLGVGTDIGGSVRSPAGACGIFSFKPTVGRIPYLGCQEPASPPGWDGIEGTHGPMARHEDDLELYMRIILDSRPWLADPSNQFRPWSPAPPLGRKLRIGILSEDGVVRPVTPIRRALGWAVDKLRSSGQFDIVDYTPYDGARAWSLISKLYWAADGGSTVYDNIKPSGEPVIPLTKWIIDEGGWGGKPAPTVKLVKCLAERDDFRLAFAHHWQDSGVDVVLSPVGPSPAPQHGTSKYWNYTSFWNLVDYPAAVFPTGLFCKESDKEDPEYQARNEREKYVLDTYDPSVSVGAPLCLQLIGYIGHDERTLSALKEMMSVLRN